MAKKPKPMLVAKQQSREFCMMCYTLFGTHDESALSVMVNGQCVGEVHDNHCKRRLSERFAEQGKVATFEPITAPSRPARTSQRRSWTIHAQAVAETAFIQNADLR